MPWCAFHVSTGGGFILTVVLLTRPPVPEMDLPWPCAWVRGRDGTGGDGGGGGAGVLNGPFVQKRHCVWQSSHWQLGSQGRWYGDTVICFKKVEARNVFLLLLPGLSGQVSWKDGPWGSLPGVRSLTCIRPCLRCAYNHCPNQWLMLCISINYQSLWMKVCYMIWNICWNETVRVEERGGILRL